MFFPSIEVRWFRRGEIPAPVLACFDQLAIGTVQRGQRTDTYLFTHDDAMGIKLREGMVEVKQRQSVLGLYDLTSNVRGSIETWYKWSFPLHNPESLNEMTIPKGNWINVYKDRRLFQSGLDEKDSTGYQAELTVIEVFGVTWWSYGIEATGAPDVLRDYFFDTIPPLLDNECPAMLEQDSFGYPAFLNLEIKNGK